MPIDFSKRFIEKANIIHNNKYDYSKSNYKNARDKIIIICKKHGDFEQIPYNHLVGKGCVKCQYDKLKSIFTKTQDQFISELIKIYGDKYTYDNTIYINDSHNVEVNCKKHGRFTKLANKILAGQGCQKCSQSIGERIIEIYLIRHNIDYKYQFRFDDCKYENKLIFDFYLLKHNMCVEFDGEQHYKSIKYFGGDVELEKLKHRDKIKTDYCIKNNINLLRIDYKNIRQIDNILSKNIN